ncbi:hypothetical protein AX16_010070 [Volvariella volvacea WC 439]|nr:hypothetical protein AX16_010070 [Volvariella volvacea WC 439]
MFLASLFLVAFARSLASPVSVTVPGNTAPSPVCIVAAAMTASQCDPTRTRTIFDILYSCIGVILLCTYISIHHNIPDQADSWAKATWSKVRTTLYALIAPEIVIMWAIRQRVMAGRIAEDNRDRGWTKTHGFFVQMGGLVQRRSDSTYRVLCESLEVKNAKIPSIPEREIQDHGKGDLLAKAIVVVQTTWFVAQCIARKVQGLVLTEIELVTLAFAALNVVTYALWWNKPLNIGYPIYFDEDGIRVDGPLAEVEELKDNEGEVKEWEEAWYSRAWVTMRGWGEACQSAWKSLKESWRESRREYGLKAVVVAPFEAIFTPLLDMMVEEGSGSRPTSVHPFHAARTNDRDGYLTTIYGSAIGVVFGAIHLIGWNFQFPTATELWLWRASSLVLTVVPFFLAVGTTLLQKYDNELVLGFTGFAGAPVYFAARVILLFLAFFTLRDLPDSAYQNVRWTEYIPHI